ncbi:YafY family protein [Achromobacter sp. MFA1 R4]|uniref:helix-turn-helix transcriptional regulator n=1 Tax=Achromobacter sp. MFA1 R4 TaxID=1881016 RepID=UPI0009539349|nr:WYL domain-containing protein [Achromobacter sp. MFA1 R4]SIT17346.1 WYL domain-containing protein [Achromobacter sp. MFA1 R4]
MGPNQTLVDNLLRILPYVEDEEADAMVMGMGMAEIREKLAALQNPVPGDKQIRRTLLKLDSVGSFGATRGKLWYRTLQRTDFRIRNMNANMAMAMCALKQVADRHLPAVVLDDLAATFDGALRYLETHQAQPGIAPAHDWSRKILRIDGTHPTVLPEVPSEVYRQVSGALYYNRKLTFRNTPFGEKTPSERVYVMTPLAMVDRAGVLYMVAWGARQPGRRFLFRMDRLSEVRLLDEAADPDPTFDLHDYVRREEALNFDPGGETRIRLHAAEPMMEDGRRRRHPLREFWLSPDQTIDEDDAGFTLTATVRPSVMLWQLLHGHASSIEVLEPEDIRERFAHEARELARRYL